MYNDFSTFHTTFNALISFSVSTTTTTDMTKTLMPTPIMKKANAYSLGRDV